MPVEAESYPNRGPFAKFEVLTTKSSSKTQRIPALDFTKGVLVLIMVLYHWINYFIGPQWPYYQYLRFLTPSFIFISGFMISSIYLSKYNAVDPRLPRRLFTRGLKLMAVFLVLNIVRGCVIPILGAHEPWTNPLTPRNIFTIFVSGNSPVSGDKLAAFPILVPISYLLMLSGALMFPYRFQKYTFHFVCMFLLLSILMLQLVGAKSPNLECIAIGMLGVLAGFISMDRINRVVRHRLKLIFAYLCYTITIAIWNDPFPLLIAGVSLSLMVIYSIGKIGDEYGTLRSEVTLLGKYSLLGYISQIAILQILSAMFRHVHLGNSVLGISFVLAFFLTVVTVEIVDRARMRVGPIDRLYKAVFA